MIALCQHFNLPARLVSGFWAGAKSHNDMHVWCEAQLPDGNWLPMDPAIDWLTRRGRDIKSGKFGFVGSDRIALSVGCDINLTVGTKVIVTPLLQHPIFVPREEGESFLLHATTEAKEI